jgi:hypothetical protein
MRRQKRTSFAMSKFVVITIALAAIIPALFITASPRTAFAHSCEDDGCIEEGRMTGGGRIDTDIILTHGFELHCNPSDSPNNLEINWDKGNRFHLESVTDINCFDDPAYNPRPPAAPFDTLELAGFGRYNGESGAFVWVQLTDFGEPGKNDWATIVVYDAEGNLLLDVTGHLELGNHQAHKSN